MPPPSNLTIVYTKRNLEPLPHYFPIPSVLHWLNIITFSSIFPADSELRGKIPSEHQGLTDSSNTLNIGCQKRSGSSGVGSHIKTMVGWAEDVTTAHHTPSRPVMPMSERQQIALLMQMSSPSPPGESTCDGL